MKCLKILVVGLAFAGWLMAQQPITVTDGSNGTVAVKAAATPPAVADKAHVVALSPNNTGLPVNLPAIVHKASANVGGATVKTLTDTITSTTAGNSLIVDVCAGEVVQANIVLTITETGGSDTWTLAATQAQSTTFACSIYYATNITAGVTAVIATFSGSSSTNTTIAMEAYEVSGLIALTPQVLDTTATGNATSTSPSAGPAQPDNANEYAFAAFGIGTAAQTVTLGGTGTWVNDSGQINPTSASGLFSFVGASQFRNNDKPLTAAGTITSEPWVVVEALFTPVSLSIDGIVQIYDGTTNAKVIAGTNALKTDMSSVAGTATDVNSGTKSNGTQRVVLATDQPQLTNKLLVTPDANVKVNIVGNAGANVDGATGAAVPANAILMGGTDGTNTVAPYVDPCQRGAKTYTSINLASSTALKLVTLASAKITYVCSINLITATAQNIVIVSGTKTTTDCDTSTTNMAGGATASVGWNFAANGGIALGNGASAVMAGGSAKDVCIISSSTGQVSGTIVWVQY
jgi:hypothetical protein